MEKKKLTLKEIGKEKLIVIFAAGVFLLLLSLPSFQMKGGDGGSSKVGTEETQPVMATNKEADYASEMEKRLSDILGKVEGIGAVKVMITVKGSSEKVALKDNPYTEENTSETDASGGSRTNESVTKEDKTVMTTQGSADSMPYIIKEKEPEVEGVLILAEGGNEAALISEIVDAVQVLFPVPAHKIKVMKMESGKK